MIDIINLEIVNNGLCYHNKTFSDPQLCQVVYSPDTAASLRNFIEFIRHESCRSYFILSHGSIILVTNWCQISSYFKITSTHNDDRWLTWQVNNVHHVLRNTRVDIILEIGL